MTHDTRFPVHPYRYQVQDDFLRFLEQNRQPFPVSETLRMDLHCHDHNSDIPDELWGRILRLPETWLPTDHQVRHLRKHKMDVLTITNHNNARSCWELMEQGEDVLPGCEFSVSFSKLELSAHVLCYGFTPAQEFRLNELRRNGESFLDFCRENDLPLILPHPLFLYHQKPGLSPEVFEQLALMFDCFEVVNGQRDVLQNLLTIQWVRSMTPDNLERWSKKHGIAPDRWCRSPYIKRMSGGSDDHFALFSGQTGTLLHVPDLESRSKSVPRSLLALEAIRQGHMAPFGQAAHDEKLSVAFIDYFCQVALKMEDPGLLRMALHRGNVKDKLACLMISNAMQELKRHKYTIRFLNVFHDALQGQKPGMLTTLSVNKDYRPLLDDVANIAAARKGPVDEIPARYLQAIESMFLKLNKLVARRLSARLGSYIASNDFQNLSTDEMIRRFEFPSHLRQLAKPDNPSNHRRDMTMLDVAELMDQLSFPTLAAGLIAGARFAGSRVVYNDRTTVRNFARSLGASEPPSRVLWLTDTLFEKNGVSNVLLATLKEVQERNLPIDFLVCSDDIEPQDHLIVVPPVGSFSIPRLTEQKLHFPNLLDVQKVFQQGAYDRVMASTEFAMGGIALYLQQAFKVPAYMYMHTDWMDYVKHQTRLDSHNLDRIRRLLRAFYRQFDGIFVLNSEHQDWLTSPAIGIRKGKVHRTAHWTAEWFQPGTGRETRDDDAPALMFAGRLSEEKGVLEIPGIFARIREHYPRAILRFAGTGPAEKELRRLIPEADFLGWVDNRELPAVYADSDLLLLPSRFDTFGCVVTEAMSCGVPVAAFNTKGPRDIIEHGKDGLLGADSGDLAEKIVSALQQGKLKNMRAAALHKAAAYNPLRILDQLMEDMNMSQ